MARSHVSNVADGEIVLPSRRCRNVRIVKFKLERLFMKGVAAVPEAGAGQAGLPAEWEWEARATALGVRGPTAAGAGLPEVWGRVAREDDRSRVGSVVASLPSCRSCSTSTVDGSRVKRN